MCEGIKKSLISPPFWTSLSVLLLVVKPVQTAKCFLWYTWGCQLPLFHLSVKSFTKEGNTNGCSSYPSYILCRKKHTASEAIRNKTRDSWFLPAMFTGRNNYSSFHCQEEILCLSRGLQVFCSWHSPPKTVWNINLIGYDGIGSISMYTQACEAHSQIHWAYSCYEVCLHPVAHKQLQQHMWMHTPQGLSAQASRTKHCLFSFFNMVERTGCLQLTGLKKTVDFLRGKETPPHQLQVTARSTNTVYKELILMLMLPAQF